MGMGPLWPAVPSHQPHVTCTQAPVLSQRDPILSLQGVDIVVGWARCHMTHMLKQNKEIHNLSEIGKDRFPQDDKPSMVNAGSFFFLFKM